MGNSSQVATLVSAAIACGLCFTSCNFDPPPEQKQGQQEQSSEIVSVAQVRDAPLKTTLTLSSELVPFQEIDVYAKESGYLKHLYVDYGTHVRQGQVMAVLDIPELQAKLEQDEYSIKAAGEQVVRAQHAVNSVSAQANVANLIYERLNGVFQTKPGLVARQEVDDAQGKNLSLKAQLEAAEADLANAQSQVAEARAKLKSDSALFEYSRITAPFTGVVTQRYANLGALMSAGTNSSTQALPLVRLSQEDVYRLSIPVPESDVRFIKIGSPVQVQVSSLDQTFVGHVARISVQVASDTRTMYTEVDVQNRNHQLMPGMYCEAVLTLQSGKGRVAVPVQAVDRGAPEQLCSRSIAATKLKCETSLSASRHPISPKFFAACRPANAS